MSVSLIEQMVVHSSIRSEFPIGAVPLAEPGKLQMKRMTYCDVAKEVVKMIYVAHDEVQAG